MRFCHNYKLKLNTKHLAAVGLMAAYCLGFSAKVYSPVHLGRYLIPIPTLTTQAQKTDPVTTLPGNVATHVPSTNQPQDFRHTNIITTYFWVGEPGDSDNGNIANSASTWDEQWLEHYGGVDKPAPRSGYLPAGFVPKENSFYFALPYSDINDSGQRKTTAVNCPLSSQQLNYSWCKNSWIAIRHNDKTVYAQWEDAGPFGEDDTAYVFGSNTSRNRQGVKAGLDVSPAIKDYLGLQDVDTTDWVFVSPAQVPNGPWRTTITTSLGQQID